MDIRFGKISSVQRAVQLLRKFERLELPNLGIPEKYAKILAAYGREVDSVSKFYQKNKQDPPIARDLPEIAGKVHSREAMLFLSFEIYQFLVEIFHTCWFELTN